MTYCTVCNARNVYIRPQRLPLADQVRSSISGPYPPRCIRQRNRKFECQGGTSTDGGVEVLVVAVLSDLSSEMISRIQRNVWDPESSFGYSGPAHIHSGWVWP